MLLKLDSCIKENGIKGDKEYDGTVEKWNSLLYQWVR
jgi:hypothetical protein